MASSVALSLSVESDPLLLLVSRVRNRAEILGTLRRLGEPSSLAGFVVDGFRGTGFVTRIGAIDPVGGTFRLEAPIDPASLAGLRDGGHGTFVGVVDDTRVQFCATPVEASAGSRWLDAPIPPMVHRLPRRLALRARLGASQVSRTGAAARDGCGADARIRALVQLAPDTPPLPVRDLSITGLALQVPSAGPLLRAGDVLPRCRISLPGQPPLTADLWVRHLHPGIGADDATTVGCVLAALPAEDERLLRRWLFAIQRGG